jgi:hypothetical protein
LRGAKVPTMFSANMKRLVSMNDLLISRFNAHNCQVMLTGFLPSPIRAIKTEFVKWSLPACVTSCQYHTEDNR